jgi:hypothetical protein
VIEDDVRWFSFELFDELVCHGLLAFDAIRLAQRGNIERAGHASFAQEPAGIGDGAGHAVDLGAVQLAFAEEGRRRVLGHGHGDRQSRTRTVGRESARRIAGGRRRQRAGA